MKIDIITADIFNSDVDAIVHQTNCLGKMGSGFALQIKNKYPEVYKEYNKLCLEMHSQDLLGGIQTVLANDGKYIINLFGQLKYGKNGEKYTNELAFTSGLRLILKDCEKYNINKIGFPYMIGCGYGGGDWNVIYNLIKTEFKNTNKELIFFKK